MGCPAPLVGHNCIIRLSAMLEVAEERKRQGILAGFGGLMFWSELTPGEVRATSSANPLRSFA